MHRAENVHRENQTKNTSLAADTRRLVITFHTPADNNQTHHLPQNYSVIKQYGRRLILDLGRPFDLETERAFLQAELRSVESVEPDSLVELQTLVQALYESDDSGRGVPRPSLWNLLDAEPYSIHAEGVWRFTNSTPDVVVAVIDSGLAEVAKPLFLSLLEGYDFVSDDGISLDGDGRDPDSTDPGDTSMTCRSPGWHGTKVASILAARHDNEWGMRGVAQNCSVLPLRVLGECSVGYASDVTDAIVWAAGGQINGIPSNPDPSRIISLSLAGRGACPGYLQSAVNQASSLGAMLVAAAGNHDQDVADFFPANCVGVVAVAASTREGTLASYSNWGSSVAIAAPGGDMADPIMALGVHPLENGLAVTYGVGTSFAVPQVAAAAAALHPNVSDAGFDFYYTPFAGGSLRLCGKGILSLRKGEHESAAEAYSSDENVSLGNETLFPASAPPVCSPGQHTFDFLQTICHTCPAGTFRNINSAPVPGLGQFGPWFPMRFTWGGNVWRFANRYYDLTGTSQVPVYFTRTNLWIGGANYGIGCGHFGSQNWFFRESSVSNPPTTCLVGGSGHATGFFGQDRSLQTAISAATDREWCIPCDAGFFSPSPSATICQACAPGTFSAGVGATACTPCSLCHPGSFRWATCTSTTNTVCEGCPFVPTYTAERIYPPEPFNSASAESAMTFLGQQAFTESILLSSVSLPYGSGPYPLVSSSRHSTTSQKSNLFKIQHHEGLAHWATLQYSRGSYLNNAFLVFGYTGDWIFVRIPSRIVLTKFVFYTRTGFVQRAPGRWRCYGSTDGQHFREIPGGSEPARLASTAYSSGFFTKIVNPATPTPYRFIGWTIAQLVGDDSILNFGKIEIFGMEFASVRSTHYSINPGSTACTPCTSCPPGQFAILWCSEMADSVCQSCPAGTYSTAQGSASCARCAAGQYSTALGAVSEATCLACPPGQFSTALGAVSVAACLQCSSGQYSTAFGAVSVAACLQCSPGQFSTALGAVSVAACLQCPHGQYSTAWGLTSSAQCDPCPPNTNASSGSASLLDCVCLPGYTCAYTKRIHVVIRVRNATASQFNNNNNLSAFLAAVAKAAGVGVSQVTVLNVTEASRRLMPGGGDEEDDNHVLYHLEVVDAVRVDTAALHSRTIAVAWAPAHALRVRRLDAA